MTEVRSRLALSAVVAAGVGVPVASAFATGAMEIPHNDDWAYSRIALDLAESGDIDLVGWGQPTLIGHVLWVQPFLAVFGHSLVVLHLTQSLAAVLGLVLAYLVAREFLSRHLSLLSTAVIAAFPGYALVAPSYMSDTTAFAAQMGCLVLGLRALRQRRAGHLLLAASILVGAFGYTIREIALAAPLAVLVGRHFALRARRERALTAGVALAILAFAVVFFVWRQSLPGDDRSSWLGDASYYRRVEDVVRAYFTCAFAVFPAVLIALLRPVKPVFSRAALVVACGVFTLGAITVARGADGEPLTLFAGNSLTRFGAIDNALPGRPVLFSLPVWAAMTLIALLAGVAVALLLTRAVEYAASRRRAPESATPREGEQHRIKVVVLSTYSFLTIGALLLRAAAGTAGLFDRYLWSVGLAVAIIIAAASGVARMSRSLLVAFAAMGSLMTLSLVVVLEEQTSAVARWDAGLAAVASGLPATRVDAGFEWMGWHYEHDVGSYTGPPRWHEPASGYNIVQFRASANCVLMSYSPRRESWLELIEARSYRPFAFWGRRVVYVYRNPPACGS